VHSYMHILIYIHSYTYTYTLIYSYIYIHTGECERFVTSLKTNKHLVALDLSENLIGSAENLNTVMPDLVTGGEALAELLRSSGCVLQSLKLGWNMLRLGEYMYMYMCIYIYLYNYNYILIYIYSHTYILIYSYTHTHTHTRRSCRPMRLSVSESHSHLLRYVVCCMLYVVCCMLYVVCHTVYSRCQHCVLISLTSYLTPPIL
jgi:hypothetical protein